MSADNWTICPQCKSEEFREDYEIGVRGDMFDVSYFGRCRKCKFEYKFKYEQKMKS